MHFLKSRLKWKWGFDTNLMYTDLMYIEQGSTFFEIELFPRVANAPVALKDIYKI